MRFFVNTISAFWLISIEIDIDNTIDLFDRMVRWNPRLKIYTTEQLCLRTKLASHLTTSTPIPRLLLLVWTIQHVD